MSKKTLLPFVLPLVIFLTGLGFLLFTFYKNTSSKSSALSVTSKYKEAKVYFRDKLVGTTPIEKTDVSPGKAELRVAGDNFEFKREITITQNTLTSINYDTAVSQDFSAGYIVWYDKTGGSDAGIFVSSNPVGAKVFINGKEIGETPVNVSDKDILNSQENAYTLTIEKDGYENQKMNLKLDKGYTLNIFSNLFLKPFPPADKIKQFSTDDYKRVILLTGGDLAKNYHDWELALSYWLETRGNQTINDLTFKFFDYFIDKDGVVYNGRGSTIDVAPINLTTKPEEPLTIALLTDSETDPTDKQTQALSTLFGGSVLSTSKYVVAKTPTGFLNIRETPSTSAVIVGKYNVGDSLDVVSKEGTWYKVKYNNKDAYVSAQYVSENKKEQ